jgi:hypothetical protein
VTGGIEFSAETWLCFRLCRGFSLDIKFDLLLMIRFEQHGERCFSQGGARIAPGCRVYPPGQSEVREFANLFSPISDRILLQVSRRVMSRFREAPSFLFLLKMRRECGMEIGSERFSLLFREGEEG